MLSRRSISVNIRASTLSQLTPLFVGTRSANLRSPNLKEQEEDIKSFLYVLSLRGSVPSAFKCKQEDEIKSCYVYFSSIRQFLSHLNANILSQRRYANICLLLAEAYIECWSYCAMKMWMRERWGGQRDTGRCFMGPPHRYRGEAVSLPFLWAIQSVGPCLYGRMRPLSKRLISQR